jgi:CBS-domain-containing membrane protein
VTCSAARYLLVAGFVGVAASSLSGNDLVGVLAAAVAVLAMMAIERLGPRRGAARSCPLPSPALEPTTDRPPADRTTHPG